MLLYFFIFLLSLSGTYLLRNIALRQSIVDIPNERSLHAVPTPRGGGLSIALAWFVGVSVLFFTGKMESSLYLAILCGLPVMLVGLLDDLMTLSSSIRLLVQVLAAMGALYFLGGLEAIDLGWVHVHLHPLLNILPVLGIVWFTNLFNFLDGMDGYLGSETVFIGLAMFLLFGFEPALLLAVAAAGFLVWNWQPAKIFMGDVGSTLIGFNVAILAIYYQNTGESSLALWMMISSVFWFDATLTLLRRLINREQLSLAHKKHFYQRFSRSGFSHQRTVILAMTLNLIIFLLVILGHSFQDFLMFSFLLNLIILLVAAIFVEKRKGFNEP